MSIGRVHSTFARIFYQRCFYLFLAVVGMLAASPFLNDTPGEQLFLQSAQFVVVVAAVAAVGRGSMPFVIAVLLGLAPLGMHGLVLLGLDEPRHAYSITGAFYLAFYLVAIIYLLRYVFSKDVMNDDKLFGAAACYMMLGIAWAFAYALVQYLDPPAFAVGAGKAARPFHDFLYMSFGVLTSNGPGDMPLAGDEVKTLVILEQVTGTLFVAILIARLAGIYPPRDREGPAS